MLFVLIVHNSFNALRDFSQVSNTYKNAKLLFKKLTVKVFVVSAIRVSCMQKFFIWNIFSRSTFLIFFIFSRIFESDLVMDKCLQSDWRQAEDMRII